MLSWNASLWERGVAFCAGSALQDEPAIIAPDREEIAAFQHDPRHLGFQRYRLLTDAPPLHETADCVAEFTLKANELCSPRIVIAPPGALERLPFLTGHSRAPKQFRCNCDQR